MEIWENIVHCLSDAETLVVSGTGDNIREILLEERFHALISLRFLRPAAKVQEAREYLERSVMFVNELESRWQALGQG